MGVSWQRRGTVEVLPNGLEILTMPWCRQALLWRTFFVKYFIDLETLPQDRPRGSDTLTEIAHSFWN